MLDAAINKAMRDVSGRLHAFANTNDAKVKDADPDALATSVDGQLRTFSNGDLVQAWKSKLKELQGGQTNTEWLVQFTDSLTAWQLYLNKKRPSNGMPFWQAQDYSWRVITALHLARTQVKNSTDNQVKANAEEYSSYFDFMAMSIYECLQTV
jgi:hypothetical protein